MKFNIFKNFTLKLTSVFIAFILWVLVTGRGTSIVDFSIPLQFLGLSTDLAIAGVYVDRIDIRVKAANTVIQQLNASQIDATVNLSGLQEGEHVIPMTFDRVRVPFGVEVVKVDPSRISLTIQKRIEKRVPIVPLLVGRTAKGYEQVDVRADPSFATISGAESDVNAVEKTSTDAILFANRNSSFTVSAKVIVDNPNVTVVNPSIALIEVEIAEVEIDKSFVDLLLIVQNTTYNTKQTPDKIEVVVTGGKSVIENPNQENIKAIVNLTDLKPRGTPYDIEPTIE